VLFAGHHTSSDSAVIPVHPDFRVIALANRPGFPFLGNDFYAALGDMFSCHAVDNPDLESELTMLKQYGRDVPEHLLEKLVGAFSELRAMADCIPLLHPGGSGYRQTPPGVST
jgi:hypothetical protein